MIMDKFSIFHKNKGVLVSSILALPSKRLEILDLGSGGIVLSMF